MDAGEAVNQTFREEAVHQTSGEEAVHQTSREEAVHQTKHSWRTRQHLHGAPHTADHGMMVGTQWPPRCCIVAVAIFDVFVAAVDLVSVCSHNHPVRQAVLRAVGQYTVRRG